jgi:hypothetical protein
MVGHLLAGVPVENDPQRTSSLTRHVPCRQLLDNVKLDVCDPTFNYPKLVGCRT